MYDKVDGVYQLPARSDRL